MAKKLLTDRELNGIESSNLNGLEVQRSVVQRMINEIRERREQTALLRPEVTFVHASSESGDHYYFCFDGRILKDKIPAAVRRKQKLEAWDEEQLYVEHVEYYYEGK